jgi:hypothetical protein
LISLLLLFHRLAAAYKLAIAALGNDELGPALAAGILFAYLVCHG